MPDTRTSACARRDASVDARRSEARRRYRNVPAAARIIAMATPNASVRRSLIGHRPGSRTSRSVRFGAQSIPCPTDRFDRIRAEGAVDLVPQVLDEDVDDVRTALVRPVPDVLDQPHAGEHLAGMAHEEFEQRELLRGQ